MSRFLMSRFFIFCGLMLIFCGQSVQAQTPLPQTIPKPKSALEKAPKMPTFAASLARAKAFKAAGNYKAAKNALYDAMDVDWRDPRPAYYLGWIAVAEKNNAAAIYNFRRALRDGLAGKDASEARAA